MKSIYKYTVDEHGIFHFHHYVEKFLKLDFQNNIPTVWAIVDTEKEPNFTHAVPVGTGWDLEDPRNPNPIEEDLPYIGTLQTSLGFVWHYFAIPKQ